MASMAKLSNAEIRKYAVGIESARFPYFCAATSELGEGLMYVVRTTIIDLCRYGITHRWKRTAAWQKP